MQTLVEVNLARKDWVERARESITALGERFRGSNSMEDVNGNPLQARRDH